jgi:hypothetical protein
MKQQTMKPAAFKRAAAEVVPVADVYRQAEAPSGSTFAPVDKFAGKISQQMNFQKSGDFWNDVASNFSSTASKLTQYFNATGEGLSFDTGRLKSELGAQFGNYSFMNDLTDGQLDSLGGYMQGGSLQILYGQAQEIGNLASGDGLNASSIVSAAQSLLGSVAGIELINNSAIFGLANLVLDTLESTGMTSLLDDIISKVREERALNEMLEQRAIGAAGEANISLCRHYVDSMGYSRAYSIRNDIIPMILWSYKLGNEDNRPFVERANEIVDLLYAIDKDWLNEAGLPTTRWFHGMSEDAIKVFSFLPNSGRTQRLASRSISAQLVNSGMDAVTLATQCLGVQFLEL